MDTRGILDMLDLTLLSKDSTEEEIEEICNLANLFQTASICIFPEQAALASKKLDRGISLGVVAGGFPIGSTSPEDIFREISEAASPGVHEIDCVLEPTPSTDYPGEGELARLIAMREASRGLVLKVILEAPLLDERQLRSVTRMALSVGVDFVKSCTGKRGNCTEEDARILAEEVGRHCLSFQGCPGVKLSGGIRTIGDAERMVGVVLGQDGSISGKGRLRIGSSSLINNLPDGGLGRN